MSVQQAAPRIVREITVRRAHQSQREGSEGSPETPGLGIPHLALAAGLAADPGFVVGRPNTAPLIAGRAWQTFSRLAPRLIVFALAAGVSHAARSAEPFLGPEFVVGSNQAPITVTEYLSVTCTHCAAFENDVYPIVSRDLIATGRIRLVIREMPTAPVAVSGAGFLLARCAGPDGYWNIVQRQLRNQAAVLAAPDPAAAITQLAELAGLASPAAKDCLQDETAIAALNARRSQGLEDGVDSTPTFFINGKKLAPGARLAGSVYQGGELSFAQLLAALKLESFNAAPRTRPNARAAERGPPQLTQRPPT